MPLVARQLVDRIEIEHGRHAGYENGRLPVTYEDFEKYGAGPTQSGLGYALPSLSAGLRSPRMITAAPPMFARPLAMQPSHRRCEITLEFGECPSRRENGYARLPPPDRPV